MTVERDGHVLLIGLNRPEKRNAFNLQLLEELSAAYGLLEREDELRCGVLFAHGEHFTAGLDLAEVGPTLAEGKSPYPEGGRDPWRLDGPWSTPLIVAVQGWVMTLAIELLLAADIRIAASNARFTQLEVRRGIYPFGGATLRFPRQAGWGDAMRWLLTGEEFDAEEAHRVGLVQEIVEPGHQRSRALELAQQIAEKCAPLGVRATLGSAHRAHADGDEAAIAELVPEMVRLLGTEDGAEGVQSFLERREARFAGR